MTSDGLFRDRGLTNRCLRVGQLDHTLRGGIKLVAIEGDRLELLGCTADACGPLESLAERLLQVESSRDKSSRDKSCRVESSRVESSRVESSRVESSRVESPVTPVMITYTDHLTGLPAPLGHDD